MAEPKIYDIRDSVEEQIDELRSQIASLTKSLAFRAKNAADSAADATEDARGRLGSAVATVRQQGHSVVEAARENPGTATSVLLTAGLAGLAVGYILGTQNTDNSHHSRWRR